MDGFSKKAGSGDVLGGVRRQSRRETIAKEIKYDDIGTLKGG